MNWVEGANVERDNIKLFTIGPVQMYPSTTTIRAEGFPHFRTDEYSNVVKQVLKTIAGYIGIHEDNSLIYLAGSGTASMEAVVENCTTKKDKALVINGGSFGHRFCELLKYHEIPYDSIDLKWDEALTSNHLLNYEKKGYTTLFVNLHETSTGQLYDIKMLSEFAKRNNMMLIVDAISTFLADEYDAAKYGIDVTIFSSQKGLCCSPGLSIVAFSQRMIDKINNNPNSKSVYFDFKDYLKNIPRGQTPYTPPVCVMYEIQDMINIINKEGGLDARLELVKNKCQYFRKKAQDLGLKLPPYPLSNMLTPLVFDDVDAYEVIQVLKNKYRYFVNPCGGELASKLFRVSHIGNTAIEDIDDLLEKIMLSIEEVKGLVSVK